VVVRARLWDPDHVLALHVELRDRIIGNMKQLIELGEGPNPTHTVEDFAEENGLSRELMLGVMLAGQLLETDRELNALTPEDRERAKAYLAEQEADLIETAHEIADLAQDDDDNADEEIQLLREIFELESGEE
jgi:hypothetical protein